MPRIYRYHCNLCTLALPSGWGSSVYAVQADGTRTPCSHPGEFIQIYKITGLGFDEARKRGLAGVHRDCICGDCLTQFELDYDRDPLECPGCGGGRVLAVKDMVDASCPKCGVGRIVQEDTGLIT